ncbi:MAG: hypothetical protein PHI58_07315 [Candidatus Omnitrophica bacterium]|nr:hypothetical protein [Candidatus Omnitrophota bacterium]
MKIQKIFNSKVLRKKLYDITLILIGIILTISFSQYVIPFFAKNIVHRNELLNVTLLGIPEAEAHVEKDSIEYYFSLNNTHNDISLEDIDVNIKFQSVIDKESVHQDMGVLGLEIQKGESAKNSNHANIKIEKIFPSGALVVIFSVRKNQFGKPPFHVWDFRNNVCSIEYSYGYLGSTVRRKITKLFPGDLKESAENKFARVNVSSNSVCPSTKKNMEVLMHNLFIWFSGLLFSVAAGHILIKWLNLALRKYVGTSEKPAKLTPTIGCIERAIYTIFTASHAYNYILVLFGIKIAQRLITFTKITTDEELEKAGQHANVFLICNIASLVCGLLGGALISFFSLK